MPGSYSWLFFGALRRLELQLSHSDGTNSLACGVRDDDGSAFRPPDLCPARLAPTPTYPELFEIALHREDFEPIA